MPKKHRCAVSTDTRGLHILHEPEDGGENVDVAVDIVAVHGLGGDSFSSWTHENGTNWLRDLLSTSLPTARIMSYGYDAGILTKARTEKSFTFAEGLLSELRDLRSGEARTRPLFFIAHSLGGIVIKKALIIAKCRQSQYGQLFESCKHLMFFGTPHQGASGIAGFLRRLGAALSANSSVLRELELWSDQVLETNSLFLAEIAPVLSITSFWEMNKTCGIQIVDEGSARLNQTHEDVIGLDADHHSICKFPNKDDHKFIKVARRLRSELGNVDEVTNMNLKDHRMLDLMGNIGIVPVSRSLRATNSRIEIVSWISKVFEQGLSQELRTWINPPSSGESDYLKHLGKISRRNRASTSWIFDNGMFRSWEAMENPLLWIVGRPGCGKSVLASSIVQRLREAFSSGKHPRTASVIFAFSNKQDESKKSSTALLRTVLWQIVCSGRLSISQKLEILSDCRKTSDFQLTAQPVHVSEGFEYLSSLLEKYVTFFPRLAIVFDGIDECSDPEVLTSMLMNSTILHQAGISVIIASQKVPKIAKYLNSCALRIDMEDDKVRQTTVRVIKQYIESELSESENPLIKDHVPKIAELITTKANGMFLWAAVAIPEVQAKADVHDNNTDDFFETVQELPENMEAAFLYLLDRILHPDPFIGTRRNAERQAALLRILQWTFHASRPLSVGELQSALSIIDEPQTTTISSNQEPSREAPNIEPLLRMCYPLLHVSSGVVHIMHSAFTAFVLPGNDSNTSLKISAKLGDASLQSVFAARCLTYLRQSQFKDFVECGSDENVHLRYPFLKYAVSNWVPHTLKTPSLNASLKTKINNFLTTLQAVTWLEQWIQLGLDKVRNLQSRLFGHMNYVTDSQWALKILVHSTEERLDVDPDSTQTRLILNQLGLLYKHHGMIGDAERIFQQLYEKQTQSLTLNDTLLRNTANNLAMVYSHRGKTSEAKQIYEKLLSTLESLPGDHVQSIISVSGNLASMYTKTGEYVEAEKTSNKVLEMCLATYGVRHRSTSLAYHNLGNVCLQQSKFGLAKEYSSKAADLFAESDGNESLHFLLATNNLASAERAMGNNQQATHLSLEVWKKRRLLLGESHPDTLISANNYASSLSELGRYKEATQILRDVLQHQTILFGDFHQSTLTVMSNLAHSLMRQGKHDESLYWEQLSLANRTKALGESHSDTLISINRLACTYQAMYELGKAEELFVKSFKLSTETLGPEHHISLSARTGLAELCALENRYGLAEHLAAQSMTISKAKYSEVHPSFLTSQMAWTKIIRDMGRFEEAELIFRRIIRVCRRAGVPDPEMLAKYQLSCTYRFLGSYAQAEEYALDIIKGLKGEGSTEQASETWEVLAKEQLSLALQKQKKLDKAQELIEQVIDHKQQRFGSGSIATMSSKNVLASIHLDAGRAKMAERIITPILDTYLSLFGRDNSQTGMALDVLAQSYRKQMRYKEAEPLQTQALAARQAALGPMHPLTLEMKCRYALLLWDIGRVKEAGITLVETLKQQRSVLRDGHPSIDRTMKDLEMIRATGETEEIFMTTEVGEPVHSHEQTCQNLARTLAEAQKVLGLDDPETLLVKRKLALYQRSSDQLADAKVTLEETLEKQILVLSACHVDTLTTLLELVDISDDHARIKQEQFNQCLMVAIRQKDAVLLRRLLRSGADTNNRDAETGLSALGFAVKMAEQNMVECILESGMNVDFLERDGSTALHEASKRGATTIVKVLMEKGANPNILEGANGRSALHLACFHDRPDVVQELLKTGANPNLEEEDLPLHIATGHNRPAIVCSLLDHGANIESISKDGQTPLIHAVFHNHLGMVELLVERGANIDFRTSEGCSLLHLACFKNSTSMVAFAIVKGFDENEAMLPTGFRPLHLAAAIDSVEILEELIRAGASLELATLDGDALTPLVFAARFGRLRILSRILNEPSQSPNIQVGAIRASPLHLAACHGHVEVSKRLIEAGGDINAVTISNATPMVEAVRSLKLDIVEILIAAGADVNIGRPNWTPLGLALFKKEAKVIEALVKYSGTDLNLLIFSEYTPLSLATYQSAASVVELMLAKGANPSIPSCINKVTTLHLAVQLREYAIVKLLLASGADQTLEDIFGRKAVDWVSPDDPTFSMLAAMHKTPRSRQIVTTRALIVNTAEHIRHALETGKSMAAASIRDRFETIAHGLFVCGAEDDAVVALEQCFDQKEEDGELVVEHSLTCSICRGFDNSRGSIHICRKCIMLALCEKCMNQYTSRKESIAICSHTLTEYVKIPRDSWYDRDASCDAEKSQLVGKGLTLDEWLTGLIEINK